MIQKRSCSLSTKANRPFYGIAKIRVIILYNVNIFTIYETFENVITIYQKGTKIKLKCFEKIESVRFIYERC